MPTPWNSRDAELAADRCLEVARHVLGEIRDGIEKVVGLFVNGQFGMESHAE
jgi:hypothetical protein